MSEAPAPDEERPPLRCRLGPLSRHEWLRINGRYRCLHCPALLHPE